MPCLGRCRGFPESSASSGRTSSTPPRKPALPLLGTNRVTLHSFFPPVPRVVGTVPLEPPRAVLAHGSLVGAAPRESVERREVEQTPLPGDALGELLAVGHFAALVKDVAVHHDAVFSRSQAAVAENAPTHGDLLGVYPDFFATGELETPKDGNPLVKELEGSLTCQPASADWTVHKPPLGFESPVYPL